MVFNIIESEKEIIIIPHDNDTYPWIDMMRNCFPNWYIGCYNGYENCLWTRRNGK